LSAQNAREKLSGSAAALFQRFGYARVSIRDITSAVDIRKAPFITTSRVRKRLPRPYFAAFQQALENLTEGGNETAEALFRRHFESLAPQEGAASPLLLISTLAAEGRRFPLLSYSRSPKAYATGAIGLRH
jgi:hypothetical protein